jgi:hypothetical protein
MSDREEWMDEAGRPLQVLLEGAQRASRASLPDAEAALVRDRVLRGRPPRARLLWLAASLAATLLMAVGAARLRRPAAVEVVREVAFETVDHGRVVRFEMTVYRETKKENNDESTH